MESFVMTVGLVREDVVAPKEEPRYSRFLPPLPLSYSSCWVVCWRLNDAETSQRSERGPCWALKSASGRIDGGARRLERNSRISDCEGCREMSSLARNSYERRLQAPFR